MRHVPRHVAGPRVRVVDYGIRGMHLAYDLLDGCDALVLVDALPNRGAPGHPARLRGRSRNTLGGSRSGCPRDGSRPPCSPASPRSAARAPYTVVIGCEVDDVDEGMGLSAAVAAAVPDAVTAIEEVVGRLSSHDAKVG